MNIDLSHAYQKMNQPQTMRPSGPPPQDQQQEGGPPSLSMMSPQGGGVPPQLAQAAQSSLPQQLASVLIDFWQSNPQAAQQFLAALQGS